jgi:hypothetical protein
MIMQRRKDEHAHLVSYEIETGGSDPLLPEFTGEILSDRFDLVPELGEERVRSTRFDTTT